MGAVGLVREALTPVVNQDEWVSLRILTSPVSIATDSLPLTIEVGQPVEGHVTVTVRGELDAFSQPELRGPLMQLIDDGFTVDIDMADVAFIDSSGLGVLIAAWKACDLTGRGVAVLNPSPAVHRLLEITGQLERFSVA